MGETWLWLAAILCRETPPQASPHGSVRPHVRDHEFTAALPGQRAPNHSGIFELTIKKRG